MSGADRLPAPLVPGLAALAPSYDLILCDIWGVVHDGVRHFPAATDALAAFRQGGGRVVLVTNAPRPNDAVREQITAIGVPNDAYDAIVTSGDVTLALVAARGAVPAVHIGPPHNLALLDALEASKGVRPALSDVAGATYCLCTGLFDDTTETPDDYETMLAELHGRNLPMICANPDLVVHVGDALRYCAGAIAERYVAMGGEVLYAGKPHAPIYEAALRLAESRGGGTVDRSRVLAIGDALRTDVAGGVLQGFDVLFITEGIHRDETHRTGDGRLDPEALHRLIVAAEHRPSAAMSALAW